MTLTSEQKRELAKISISNEGLFYAEESSKGALNPAIVIGLGGLGCETLNTLKKKFCKRTDNRTNVKFLAIDADEADLRSLEYLETWEKLSLIDNAEPRDLRQTGRTMLTCGPSYQRIKEKLFAMTAELFRCHSDKFDIILIAGVSGYTGGGTLIDTAYLVHRVMEETQMKKYRCSSYIYTPDVHFSVPGIAYSLPMRERLIQNGYTAMKKIDYYMNLENNRGVYSVHTSSGDQYRSARNVFTDCTIVSGNQQHGESSKQSAIWKLSEMLVDYLTDSEIQGVMNSLESNRLQMLESRIDAVNRDGERFPEGVNYTFRLLDYTATTISMDEIRTFFINKAFQPVYEKFSHADKAGADVLQAVLSEAHIKNTDMLFAYALRFVNRPRDMGEILHPNEYPSKRDVRDRTDQTYQLCMRYAQLEAGRVTDRGFIKRLKHDILSRIQTEIDSISDMYGPYYVVDLLSHKTYEPVGIGNGKQPFPGIIELLNSMADELIEHAEMQAALASSAATQEELQAHRNAAAGLLAGKNQMKAYIEFSGRIAVSAIFNTTLYRVLSEMVREIAYELIRMNKEIYEVYADALTEISKILEKEVRDMTDVQGNEVVYSYEGLSLSGEKMAKLLNYLDDVVGSKAEKYLFELFVQSIREKRANLTRFSKSDGFDMPAEIQAIFSRLVTDVLGPNDIDKFMTAVYSPRLNNFHDIDRIWSDNGFEGSRAVKSAAMEIFQALNVGGGLTAQLDTGYRESQFYSNRMLVMPADARLLSNELSILFDESSGNYIRIKSKVQNKFILSRIIFNVPLYVLSGFREYEQNLTDSWVTITGENFRFEKEIVKSSLIEEIKTLNISGNGKNKRLHVMVGDICNITEPVDLLVCSAFKNSYAPSPGTLIGALFYQRDINVYALSEKPALDLRNVGCWLSEKTRTNFSRIACVEMLPLSEGYSKYDSTEKLLVSTFSTLRFLLEHANVEGIPVRNIVMPVLGTGNQNIDINYVAPVLLSQMRQALELIDQLTDIYIYERNPDKARQLSEILSDILESDEEETPDVFISYSSKQDILAHKVVKTLTDKGISCWIAPDSISPGSDYAEEISKGIGNTKITVLVLTPDAERSKWVRKEVGASIGAGHILIPYQRNPFAIGASFMFLLEGEQILEAWKEPGDPLAALAELVNKKLGS